MRSFVLWALLPCLATAQEAARGTVKDWRFAHPEATMAGSFRPATLLDSPFVAQALAEVSKQEPQAAAMLGMAHTVLGGIREIQFSLLDNGSAEPDVLLLVSGTLDEGLLNLLAQDKAKVRRLDSGALLVGNGLSLEQAAARMVSSTPALQSGVFAGAEALDGYDFWITGKLPATPLAAGLDAKLRGVAVGVSMRDSLDMELMLQAPSEAEARALVQSAQEALASQPAELRQRLFSSAEGATARFRVSLPADALNEAVRAMPLAGLGAPGFALQPLAPAPVPPRRSVRIEGLDEGPKEIPLK